MNYKYIEGTAKEITDLLNQAFEEGFTQVFQQVPVNTNIGTINPEEFEFKTAFIMMKAPKNPLEDYGPAMRKIFTSLGLGDRLGPEPEDAKVLKIVKDSEKEE